MALQRTGTPITVCLRSMFVGLIVSVCASNGAVFADSKTAPQTIHVGRARPMVLSMQGLSKVSIEDPTIASVTVLSDNRVAIQGKRVGTTRLTFSKEDQQSSVPVIVVEKDEQAGNGSASDRPVFEPARSAEPAKTEETATASSGTSTATVNSGKPSPWVKLLVAPATGRAGEVLFSINYGNRSEAKATKVVVRDALPPELDYVKDSASSGGSYDAENRELVWKLDELAKDSEGSQLSLSFRAKPVSASASKIFNVATIECAEQEALFASNTVVWETSSSTLTAIFAMPEAFVVKRTIMMPLLDVHGEEFQAAVDRLQGLSVVSGYPDQTFRPDNLVTRAESVKMLVLGADLKEHRDATRVTFVLGRPAKVSATVLNSSGRLVKTLQRNLQQAAGDHAIPWDGRADSGEYVKPGAYTYVVKAIDAKGMETSLDGNLTVLEVERSNVSGAPSFKDVKPNDWSSGYIAEAEDRQYVKGYPDKTFKPKRHLTRVEATAMVVRALGLEKEAQNRAGKDVGFVDARQVPQWATGYVAVASTTAPKARDQLIIGYPGNTFLPVNPIRRTEAAAIVSRFVDRNVNRQQIVSGALTVGATLTINGKTIRADSNGRFRVAVDIVPYEVTTIAVLAP